MKQSIISLLRDKNATIDQFRQAADQIATLLSFEAADLIEKEERPLETPLAPAKGYKMKHEVILLPILRAGLAMLTPFLKLFPTSKVGFVGVRRDEETALPSLYYKNIPEVKSDTIVMVLDPMIATGGSGGLVIELLKAQGVAEENLIYVGVIAAPEGLSSLHKAAPKMKLICGEIDEKLNEKKYIVPGLGDFGDRYFGTVPHG